MEILVLKNGLVLSRITAAEPDAEYTLITLNKEELPAFPSEPAARGKEWELEYVDGTVVWVQIDRPLTTEEKLEALQEEIAQIKQERVAE